METLKDLASIMRLHIIGVAMAAAVTFGWLFTGRYLLAIALLGGVDWLLINLINKTTDIEEDLANEIRGTGTVARHRRGLLLFCGLVLVGSFAVTAWACPELLLYRVAVQLIGLGYSFRLVPTPSGMKRFKDLYFLKNFMSALLFCFTVFIYPVVSAGGVSAITGVPAGLGSALLLMLFFVPFELSYEVLYDLRDLEGDRAAGVPTYPVVHGPERARQIVDGLLIGCAAPLLVGLGGGWLGVREGLMLAAPLVQLVFYRPRLRRGLTSGDCIALTHLGSGMLLFFLLGTRVWLWAGLPANILLR